MRVDFEQVGTEMFPIYAATVGNYRINVTRTGSNLPSQAFVFEMNEADDPYTDIASKGFTADLDEALRRSTLKAAELTRQDTVKPSLPSCLVITDIASDDAWFTV